MVLRACWLVAALALVAAPAAPSDDAARSRAVGLVRSLPPAVIDVLGWKTEKLDMHIDAVPRCIDFVDFFAGAQHLTQAFRARQFVGVAYDIAVNSFWMNCASPHGMALALVLTLSVIAGGFIGGGFPCSTYVWLARGHTKRSRENPLGDRSRLDVCQVTAMFNALCVNMYTC